MFLKALIFYILGCSQCHGMSQKQVSLLQLLTFFIPSLPGFSQLLPISVVSPGDLFPKSGQILYFASAADTEALRI